MTTRPANGILRHLRTSLLRENGERTDGQLLECYVRRRDGEAFAALVRRHGPMVWGVCRRVLVNEQDAEDAFQATFLVLVRKAASVLPRENVANWLYGVARQTAVKAQAMAARRVARERQVGQMPESVAVERDSWSDLRPLLDGELSRLPEHYRTAVVLCDLEGRTYREAARQLGCPEGTLAARLSRARALLARRLSRHGLTLSAVALGVLLADRKASASVPAPLLSATVRSAGAIPERVLALTEGVLKAMRVVKLRTACVLLAGTLLLALGGVAGFRALASEQPAGERAGDSLRDTILVLDQQFWEASSKHDVETLGKLIASDYVGLTPDGTRWTKASLLQQHRDFRTNDLKRTTEREVFRVHPQAAMLVYEAKFRVLTRNGDPAGAVHQRMVSCWVQKDGGWFVAFAQATDVPAPARPAEDQRPEDKLNSLIDKVMKAYGGEEKLKGLKAIRLKVRRIDGEKKLIDERWLQQPDGLRIESWTEGEDVKLISILTPDGFRRWHKKGNGKPEGVTYLGLERPVEYWLDKVKYFGPRDVLRLKDPANRPGLLTEIKVGDRPAVGIRLMPSKGAARDLYFDKETGLLLREREGGVETNHADYQPFDGVPVPRKTSLKTGQGGVTHVSEVIEFRVVEKFDPKLFREP